MLQTFFFNLNQLPQPIDLSVANIVADGNSLTAGQGSTGGQNYPNQLSALIGNSVVNLGVGGQTTEDMDSDAATQVDGMYDESTDNVLLVWEVRNDLVRDHLSGYLDDLENMREYLLDRVQRGWKVVLLTILPSWYFGYGGDNAETGWLQLDSDRLEANEVLRGFVNEGLAHEICDVAAIPGLSNLTDTYEEGYVFSSTRPTVSANGLFDDGTHLTNAGYALIANEALTSMQKLKVR